MQRTFLLWKIFTMYNLIITLIEFIFIYNLKNKANIKRRDNDFLGVLNDDDGENNFRILNVIFLSEILEHVI